MPHRHPSKWSPRAFPRATPAPLCRIPRPKRWPHAKNNRQREIPQHLKEGTVPGCNAHPLNIRCTDAFLASCDTPVGRRDLTGKIFFQRRHTRVDQQQAVVIPSGSAMRSASVNDPCFQKMREIFPQLIEPCPLHIHNLLSKSVLIIIYRWVFAARLLQTAQSPLSKTTVSVPLQSAPCDAQVLCTDHEVHMIDRVVSTSLCKLLPGIVHTTFQRVGVTPSKRQVAGGVFIKQGIVKQNMFLRNRRMVGHQRNLAQTAGALVRIQQPLQNRMALRGLKGRHPPFSKVRLNCSIQRALVGQRHRRNHTPIHLDVAGHSKDLLSR